ncbi:MAG TPA: YiiD C-terminal domain-containing protein [Steroidobacteraceae bacterium]
MTPAELQQYLRTRIPLSAAMQVEVRRADVAGVELYAPLEPNTNHRDTVFGGSAATLAILAAWCALHVRLLAAGLAGRIVIHSNTMNYERPIVAGFTATSQPPAADEWQKLAAIVARGRMARARMTAVLECQGEQVGQFDGQFAVLPPG